MGCAFLGADVRWNGAAWGRQEQGWGHSVFAVGASLSLRPLDICSWRGWCSLTAGSQRNFLSQGCPVWSDQSSCSSCSPECVLPVSQCGGVQGNKLWVSQCWGLAGSGEGQVVVLGMINGPPVERSALWCHGGEHTSWTPQDSLYFTHLCSCTHRCTRSVTSPQSGLRRG